MEITNFPYKTSPLSHQKEVLERTCLLPFHALFMEMGTGKTKIIIDNIAFLYLEGKINGALIIAPNGVDLNWLVDEIPKHLPDYVASRSRIWRYSTKRSGSKAHKEQVRFNREEPKTRLSWLIMSYDAFMTNEGKESALKFLEQRTCFYTLDESVSIKCPAAKRTMRITRTAWRAAYRRILDGYPTPKGAFDLYSQIKFLDSDFWDSHGFDSAVAFRHHFGVYDAPKMNHATRREYEVLLGYQNLEELNRIIDPISTRILKKDVLDLPEKIYQPRYFELNPAQRKLYDEIESEYHTWVKSLSDEMTPKDILVTANLAMVRETRLQQISCGYLPTGDANEPLHMIEGKNTRLELQESLLENRTEKTIIWAKYRLDIQLISDMLKTQKNRKFVLYVGGMDDEDKLRSRKEFQEGDAEIFLATQDAAGIGLTLHAAHHMDYYSNSMNLRHRKQSEDRVHRTGLDHSFTITDILGLNTRDRKIILNLIGKMDTGDIILGDAPGNDLRTKLREWVKRDEGEE